MTNQSSKAIAELFRANFTANTLAAFKARSGNIGLTAHCVFQIACLGQTSTSAQQAAVQRIGEDVLAKLWNAAVEDGETL